ncbi:MAG: hypothetical protein GVY20_15505 [Bacteroidetes bacterium]|jgi:hypothetical protein|nr:hypothetical protein [Bacteroidota bacterium]
MKLLVAGDKVRGMQWEKYLRKKFSVTEVTLATDLQNSAVDAVVLLNESPGTLHKLLSLVQKGMPVYLVSSLPTDVGFLQKLYHTSEEANVSVQFSHWASFSPMTRWIRKNINKAPRYIEIIKNDHGRTLPEPHRFKQSWVDELAFLVSLVESSVQSIIAHPLTIDQKKAGIYISVRFDNGSISSVRYMSLSVVEQHERIIQTDNSIFRCNITGQNATHYFSSSSPSLMEAKHQTFNPSVTAENSLEYFLRSIKTHKASGFSASLALQTARLARRVEDQIRRS